MPDRAAHRAIAGACAGLVSLALAPLAAQTPVPMSPPPPQTRLEATLETHNILLVEDVYRVGDGTTTALGMTMEAMVVSVPPPAARVRGLRVSLHDTASPARSSVSYLDYEELDGLSNAIGQMTTIAGQWTGPGDERSSELRFASFAGFAIEIRQDGRGEKGSLVSGFLDPVRRPITVADLAPIKNAVEQAIELLKEK